MENNKGNQSILKLLFILLPIIGAMALLTGLIIAVIHMQFSKMAISFSAVGILLFFTLFIKAEVSNLKYYLHVFVYAILVLGICVVGYLFTKQYTKKVDLTEQKMYSLSPMSSKYLKNLDKEVRILIFTPSSTQFDDIRSLYSSESQKVKWEFCDAYQDPAKGLELTGESNLVNGDIFIKSAENSKRLNVAELNRKNYENVLTNGIIEVTRKDKIKIYFLTGHGEIPLEQAAQRNRANQRPQASMAALREFLTQRAMTSEKLDLTQTGHVPKDASLVVIASAQQDLLPGDVQPLKDYLGAGGKMLVTLRAIPLSQTLVPVPNLIGLLGEFGIQTPDEIILDQISRQAGLQLYQPLVATYGKDHPITRDLVNQNVRYPLSFTRPLRKGNLPEGFTFTELIKSSEKSLSTDLTTFLASLTSGRVQITPKNEGPQTMGVAVSKAAPQQPGMPSAPDDNKNSMRLVVYGSPDLIEDNYLITNNTAVQLVLNTVNWLVEQEDMIAIAPRQLKETPIILTPGQVQIILVFTVLLIPALLFFGGVAYSQLRRRS